MSLMSFLRNLFRPENTASMPAFDSEPGPEDPISARQVELVQSTWQSVEPISSQAATLFYNKLFEIDPSVQALFVNVDIEEQKRKLMQMIDVAVKGLNRLETIVPAVEALGVRHHVDYGVQNSQYDTVGAALLWTLEQGLGEAFTPEVKEAWTVTYTVLADTMKSASASAAPVR